MHTEGERDREMKGTRDGGRKGGRDKIYIYI
jgi:hypothetical protein